MKRIAIAMLAACTLTAGCAAPAYVSPVQITRFVGDSPASLGMGTVEIAAAPGMESASLEFAVYADAVSSELAALGYTVVPDGGEQVAMIGIEGMVSAEGRRRGGVGVGAGGSTGSYGSGVGVGVGVDLTSLINGPPPERIERAIFVALQPAGGGVNLWEGRASMTATSNSDYAADAAAAARMAEALFAGFPGNSGETIEVE